MRVKPDLTLEQIARLPIPEGFTKLPNRGACGVPGVLPAYRCDACNQEISAIGFMGHFLTEHAKVCRAREDAAGKASG